MSKTLSITLGICGGIACYKSIELVRLFRQAGIKVSVIMTHSACQFIQPITLEVISNQPVRTEIFDAEQEQKINHIDLAQSSDIILIAPATANIIGKFANGIADDLLTTILLASFSTIILAPSMNDKMWQNEAVQQNIGKLKKKRHTYYWS